MDKTLKWRIVLVLAVIITAAVFVYPTIKLALLSDEDKAAMSTEELSELKDRAINLGLDLQGGMHLVLEVDQSELEDTDIKNVVSRAEAIIRNRVDKFGVAEPIIQVEGEDRIVVQLAGLSDEARAKELIGQTALLEFKLVKEGDEFRQLLSEVDEALSEEIRSLTADDDTEEFERQLEEVAAETDTTGLRDEIDDVVDEGRGLLSLVRFTRVGTHEDAMVNMADMETVKQVFESAREQEIMPPDVQIVWNMAVEEGREDKFQRVYLVNRKASLTGKYINQAIVRWGIDPSYPSAPGISLEFNRLGKSLFSRVTGENIERRLAIVLDDKVHSAPNITEKIRGAASISGAFTAEKAQDLAIVLEAGALPAPLKIVEERTVGPSLGSDSIRRGVRAAIVGGAVVAIFMVVYYNMSGLLAVLALTLSGRQCTYI
jgi:protein-export membrane protein SecD